MSDKLLERIAVALETIASSPATGLAPSGAETPKKSGTKKAAATETAAAPPASTPSPAPAVQAAAGQPATPARAAAPAGADLMTQTADALMELANNYSRDVAIALLAKYGVQKVSQVKVESLQALLNDVFAAIALEKTKAANASLV